jgi:predicted DNA binding CopG/RHH family protein
MRREYDFSKAKPNPYAAKLKRPVTIRLDESTVRYFKQLAEELELPYQSLINLYLRDCAATGRTLAMEWKPASRAKRTRGRVA